MRRLVPILFLVFCASAPAAPSYSNQGYQPPTDPRQGAAAQREAELATRRYFDDRRREIEEKLAANRARDRDLARQQDAVAQRITKLKGMIAQLDAKEEQLKRSAAQFEEQVMGKGDPKNPNLPQAAAFAMVSLVRNEKNPERIPKREPNQSKFTYEAHVRQLERDMFEQVKDRSWAYWKAGFSPKKEGEIFKLARQLDHDWTQSLDRTLNFFRAKDTKDLAFKLTGIWDTMTLCFHKSFTQSSPDEPWAPDMASIKVDLGEPAQQAVARLNGVRPECPELKIKPFAPPPEEPPTEEKKNPPKK